MSKKNKIKHTHFGENTGSYYGIGKQTEEIVTPSGTIEQPAVPPPAPVQQEQKTTDGEAVVPQDKSIEALQGILKSKVTKPVNDEDTGFGAPVDVTEEPTCKPSIYIFKADPLFVKCSTKDCPTCPAKIVNPELTIVPPLITTSNTAPNVLIYHPMLELTFPTITFCPPDGKLSTRKTNRLVPVTPPPKTFVGA